jgi:glycosyltransferase involved in cell wall biosynthesis
MAKEDRLRVCYFGTYRARYGRNEILLAGLHAQGVEVHICHETLWQGIDDRVEQAKGGWLRPRFLWRVARAYWRLWRKHRQMPDYDVMLLGYPGSFDAYLGRLLSWGRKKSMVIDHYMSLYLIAAERGLLDRRPLTGRIIRALEGTGLRLADHLLADTAAYVQYHCRTYGLPADKFSLVPAGADEKFFYPRPEYQPPADCFRVVYYGTFIPNHDVPLMVQAAALLAGRADLRFDFYGTGPDLERCRELAQKERLDNMHFHGWLPKEALPRQVAQAHLVLGAFGQTPQSLMTVQNKIWEAMAMARPVLSGDSPAVRAAFRHEEEIFLVERGRPEKLAAAIEDLAAQPDLCRRLAQGGYNRFQNGNSTVALGKKLAAVLTAVAEGEIDDANTGPQMELTQR